jgi:8-oxo-dGTP diphosphatase
VTVKRRVQRALLRAFSRVPRRLRRALVRLGVPSYMVGAIGVVVVDGEVLLVRQSYRRGWGVPGGLLGRGEAAEAAVVRELWEEVGLAVVVEGPPGVVIEPRSRRVDVCYRCTPTPGCDPSSAQPSSAEIDEVGWFPVTALPDLQPEARRGLQELGFAVSPLSPSLRRTRP